MVVTLLVATISCSKDSHEQDYNPLIDDPKPEQPTTPTEPTQQDSYNEQYRPQVHFTPAKNWINDPNGMVYADGTYHLFYQYNPQGNSWGNMSWGHATSTDLIHWTEKDVALTRDELGAIFSGSAVIDKNNTAGFGANAMIAIYTSAGDDGKQQQSIAYSTDGGKNFTRYSGNPVIKNDDDNLRDPKVFWHEQSKQWVMALAKGWKMGVELYGSTDLKNWRHLSTFFVPLTGRPSLQWECPDLLQFGDKWVLLVSVNPGGPITGSGTMYFVGQFDGTTFTADDLSYPLWLDYGMDNYAGVTWSNMGDRKVMIGWMNNWSYAGDVPCSPWRSAMTLPRELKLIEYDGKPLLANTVVSEIDKAADSWQPLTSHLSERSLPTPHQVEPRQELHHHALERAGREICPRRECHGPHRCRPSQCPDGQDQLQRHVLHPVDPGPAQHDWQHGDARPLRRPVVRGTLHRERFDVDDQSRVPAVHLQHPDHHGCRQ